MDHNLYRLFGLAAIGLVAATASSIIAAQFAASDESKATAAALKARVTSSWVMSVVMMGAILVGRAGPLLLSTVISILGLVEVFRLMPRRTGDHEVKFWCLVVLTPLQYFLVAMEWHELFTILVPVGAFVLIPGRIALAGDFDHFFERVAKLQWAVMLCVYCLSHACALLTLSVPGYQGRDAELLVFFILVMAVSDVMQYATGKLFGSRKLAPRLSPHKTWEGLIGGVGAATIVGGLTYWATPFTPGQAAALSFVVATVGFVGGLTMSAIKRDAGIKDFGTLVRGHGGILDRIDAMCFSAPIFYYFIAVFFER